MDSLKFYDPNPLPAYFMFDETNEDTNEMIDSNVMSQKKICIGGEHRIGCSTDLPDLGLLNTMKPSNFYVPNPVHAFLSDETNEGSDKIICSVGISQEANICTDTNEDKAVSQIMTRKETLTSKNSISCQSEECSTIDSPHSDTSLVLPVRSSIKKPFVCELTDCQATFLKYASLKIHKWLHTSECPKSFENASDTAIHRSSQIKIKLFKCRFVQCESAFKSEKKLRFHENTHKTDGLVNSNFKRNNISVKKQSSLAKNKQNNATKTVIYCNVAGCKDTFYNKDALALHQKKHIINRLFKNNILKNNSTFGKESKLKVHKMKHKNKVEEQNPKNIISCPSEESSINNVNSDTSSKKNISAKKKSSFAKDKPNNTTGTVLKSRDTFYKKDAFALRRKAHSKTPHFKCDYPKCHNSFFSEKKLKLHKLRHASKVEEQNPKNIISCSSEEGSTIKNNNSDTSSKKNISANKQSSLAKDKQNNATKNVIKCRDTFYTHCEYPKCKSSFLSGIKLKSLKLGHASKVEDQNPKNILSCLSEKGLSIKNFNSGASSKKNISANIQSSLAKDKQNNATKNVIKCRDTFNKKDALALNCDSPKCNSPFFSDKSLKSVKLRHASKVEEQNPKNIISCSSEKGSSIKKFNSDTSINNNISDKNQSSLAKDKQNNATETVIECEVGSCGDRPCYCPKCKSLFGSEKKRKLHDRDVEVKSLENIIRCPSEELSSLNNSNSDTSLQSELRRPIKNAFKYNYMKCKSSFKDKYELSLHETVRNFELRILECGLLGCNAAFTNKLNLMSHRLKHFKTPLYSCNAINCGSLFDTIPSLLSHRQTHITSILKCNFENCNNVFSSRKALAFHFLGHNPALQPHIKAKSHRQLQAEESNIRTYLTSFDPNVD